MEEKIKKIEEEKQIFTEIKKDYLLKKEKEKKKNWFIIQKLLQMIMKKKIWLENG